MLPSKDDLVDALSKNILYSNLDLRSGYWQVRMAEESIECTVFIMQSG